MTKRIGKRPARSKPSAKIDTAALDEHIRMRMETPEGQEGMRKLTRLVWEAAHKEYEAELAAQEQANAPAGDEKPPQSSKWIVDRTADHLGKGIIITGAKVPKRD